MFRFVSTCVLLALSGVSAKQLLASEKTHKQPSSPVAALIHADGSSVVTNDNAWIGFMTNCRHCDEQNVCVAPDTADVAVRCCGMVSASNSAQCDSEPCVSGKTQAEAFLECKNRGGRLCTAEEVAFCHGTGCGFDGKKTWTGTQCELNTGFISRCRRCSNKMVCSEKTRTTRGPKAMAVRCCGIEGGRGDAKCASGDCKSSVTQQAAAVECAARGGRLCTEAEVEDCDGTGCGHDHRWVWTATRCNV